MSWRTRASSSTRPASRSVIDHRAGALPPDEDVVLALGAPRGRDQRRPPQSGGAREDPHGSPGEPRRARDLRRRAGGRAGEPWPDDEPGAGTGLLGLRERLERVGGRLEVRSAAGLAATAWPPRCPIATRREGPRRAMADTAGRRGSPIRRPAGRGPVAGPWRHGRAAVDGGRPRRGRARSRPARRSCRRRCVCVRTWPCSTSRCRCSTGWRRRRRCGPRCPGCRVLIVYDVRAAGLPPPGDGCGRQLGSC